MLDAVLNFIAETHFEYTEQFLTALLPMSLTVLLHGQGMGLIVRYLKRFGKHVRHGAAASLRNIGLIAVVGIMLLTHFIEVVAWAMFYFLTGMLSSYRTGCTSRSTRTRRWAPATSRCPGAGRDSTGSNR